MPSLWQSYEQSLHNLDWPSLWLYNGKLHIGWIKFVYDCVKSLHLSHLSMVIRTFPHHKRMQHTWPSVFISAIDGTWYDIFLWQRHALPFGLFGHLLVLEEPGEQCLNWATGYRLLTPDQTSCMVPKRRWTWFSVAFQYNQPKIFPTHMQ